MPTYVYETIPQGPDEEPVRFELRQGINAPKLTEQPGTGKPARRLISGEVRASKGELPPSVGSVTDPLFHQRD